MSVHCILCMYMYWQGVNVISRNRQGQVIKPAQFQTSVKSGEVARVQPNSKWFGKLISQIRMLANTDINNSWVWYCK